MRQFAVFAAQFAVFVVSLQGSRHSALGALLYTAVCDMVAAPSDSQGIATASQAWVYWQEQVVVHADER